MNIGIIGSGGREHALCLKLKESSLIKKYSAFQVMRELVLSLKILMLILVTLMK